MIVAFKQAQRVWPIGAFGYEKGSIGSFLVELFKTGLKERRNGKESNNVGRGLESVQL